MLKTLAPLVVALLAVSVASSEDSKTKTAFDPAKMVGSWKIVSGEKAGEKTDKERLAAKITISKDAITIDAGDAKFVMGYTVDAKATPMAIDMIIKEGQGEGTKAVGIIGPDGDGFKLCYVVKQADDTKRPTKFESTKDKEEFLFVLKPAK